MATTRSREIPISWIKCPSCGTKSNLYYSTADKRDYRCKKCDKIHSFKMKNNE